MVIYFTSLLTCMHKYGHVKVNVKLCGWPVLSLMLRKLLVSIFCMMVVVIKLLSVHATFSYLDL